MKYVIFEKPDGLETVRVFDEITDHSQVAAEVLTHRPGLKLISAGKLLYGDDGGLYCVSGSTTLKIEYKQKQSIEDTDLLIRFFRFRA